jgi:putative endonuclease
MREYYVYILASGRNGTLYIGVANDLSRRVYEHREGTADGFTKRYGVKLLVYVESYPDVRDAIARERMLKKWRRAWKLKLIEASNPQWQDLYSGV